MPGDQMKLRVGRNVPRNLYVQVGDIPSKQDIDVGRLDNSMVARLVVDTVNSNWLARERLGKLLFVVDTREPERKGFIGRHLSRLTVWMLGIWVLIFLFLGKYLFWLPGSPDVLLAVYFFWTVYGVMCLLELVHRARYNELRKEEGNAHERRRPG